MTYSIFITRQAQKELTKLSTNDYLKIKAKIQALSENPRPPGSKKLKGREGWRIRSGNYRVIYDIKDDKLLVKILKIRHRKDIYR